MKHTFTHFEIPADDVERAKSFYEGLLGWKITPAEGFDGYWFVLTSDDESDLHGGMMAREAAGQAAVYYIDVEDIDAYLARLQTLGGEIVVPKLPVPAMGWMAHFRDPEGNLFGLWQSDTTAK